MFSFFPSARIPRKPFLGRFLFFSFFKEIPVVACCDVLPDAIFFIRGFENFFRHSCRGLTKQMNHLVCSSQIPRSVPDGWGFHSGPTPWYGCLVSRQDRLLFGFFPAEPNFWRVSALFLLGSQFPSLFCLFFLPSTIHEVFAIFFAFSWILARSTLFPLFVFFFYRRLLLSILTTPKLTFLVECFALFVFDFVCLPLRLLFLLIYIGCQLRPFALLRIRLCSFRFFLSFRLIWALLFPSWNLSLFYPFFFYENVSRCDS